jgi:DNA-binding MarR family transcriptional regulator
MTPARIRQAPSESRSAAELAAPIVDPSSGLCSGVMVDSVNQMGSEGDGAALLRDVTRLYIRAQRQTVACCGPQSTARCHVLGELARGGPLRLTDLAARLDVDKSWASRTVAAMAEEGLVACGCAQEDARAIQLDLTRAGRAHWKKLDGALRRHADEMLRTLSQAERRTVRQGLALLRRLLAQETALGSACAQAGVSAGRRTAQTELRTRREVRRDG